MKNYCCMYRCRQCGAVFKCGIIDGGYINTFISMFRNEAQTHNCECDALGVGELIGFIEYKGD